MPRFPLSTAQHGGIGNSRIKLAVRDVAPIDNALETVDQEGASVGHV
jgi:hypothetical protein